MVCLTVLVRKNIKKSENGEIYTAGTNFTLPLAVTAVTNSTSERTYRDAHNLLYALCSEEIQHYQLYCFDSSAFDHQIGMILRDVASFHAVKTCRKTH